MERAFCHRCGDDICPFPNDHGGRWCESGLPEWGYHDGLALTRKVIHPDGRVRYLRLCGVCREAEGGYCGPGVVVRWSWFGRRLWFRLTGR